MLHHVDVGALIVDLHGTDPARRLEAAFDLIETVAEQGTGPTRQIVPGLRGPAWVAYPDLERARDLIARGVPA